MRHRTQCAVDAGLRRRVHVFLDAAFEGLVADVVAPDGAIADEEALGGREAVDALVSLGLVGHLVGVPGNVQATKVSDVFAKGEFTVDGVALNLMP